MRVWNKLHKAANIVSPSGSIVYTSVKYLYFCEVIPTQISRRRSYPLFNSIWIMIFHRCECVKSVILKINISCSLEEEFEGKQCATL